MDAGPGAVCRSLSRLAPYRSLRASIRLSLARPTRSGGILERGTFQEGGISAVGGEKMLSSPWSSSKFSRFSACLAEVSSGVTTVEPLGALVVAEVTVSLKLLMGVSEVASFVLLDVLGCSPSLFSPPSPLSLFSTALTPTIKIGTKLGSVVLGESGVVNLNILKKFMARRGEAWFALCKELESSAASRPLRRPARKPSNEVSDVGFENEVGTVSDGGDGGPNMFLRKLPERVRSLSTREEAVAVAAIASKRARTVA